MKNPVLVYFPSIPFPSSLLSFNSCVLFPLTIEERQREREGNGNEWKEKWVFCVPFFLLSIQLNYNGMTTEERNESMNLAEWKRRRKKQNTQPTNYSGYLCLVVRVLYVYWLSITSLVNRLLRVTVYHLLLRVYILFVWPLFNFIITVLVPLCNLVC